MCLLYERQCYIAYQGFYLQVCQNPNIFSEHLRIKKTDHFYRLQATVLYSCNNVGIHWLNVPWSLAFAPCPIFKYLRKDSQENNIFFSLKMTIVGKYFRKEVNQIGKKKWHKVQIKRNMFLCSPFQSLIGSIPVSDALYVPLYISAVVFAIGAVFFAVYDPFQRKM